MHKRITIVILIIFLVVLQAGLIEAKTNVKTFLKCINNQKRCFGQLFQNCEQNDWVTVQKCQKGHCTYQKGCLGVEPKFIAAKPLMKKTVQKKEVSQQK